MHYQHQDRNTVASKCDADTPTSTAFENISCRTELTEEQNCCGEWRSTTTKVQLHSSLLDRISSLVMICELTETQFEPLTSLSQDLGEFDSFSLPPDPSTIETRWSPESDKQRKRRLLTSSSEMTMPERMPSCSDIPLEDDWLPDEKPLDAPNKAPIRAKSIDELDCNLFDNDNE